MADMFTEFWSICPRKVGKKAAEKEYWKARKDVEHDVLCNAMQRFADYHKAKGTALDYIPHPRTWLCQGRWEDQTPEPPPLPSNGAAPQLPPCYKREFKPRARKSDRLKLRLEAQEVMRKRGEEPLYAPPHRIEEVMREIRNREADSRITGDR